MSEIDAFLKSRGGRPGSIDSFLGTEPPKETGFVRTQADRALALGQGLVGGVKALADIAGTDTAVSRGLGNLNEDIEGLYSPARNAERRARQQAIDKADQSGSTIDQVTSRLGGFAEAPAQTLLQGIGSMGPTLAAAVATRGHSLAPSLGVGTAMGIGGVKGQNYDAVKNEALSRGIDAATAERMAARASEYSIENLPQQALGGALGALDAGTGVERLIGNLAGGKQAAAGLLKRVGKGAAEEAVPEGLQGSQGQYEQNEALNRAGFQTDPMSGVLGAGVHDAAVGAVLGAAAGAPRGRAETPNARPTQQQEVGAQPAEQPQPAEASPPPVAAPAVTHPQAIRAQKLPETGPLSGAVNAGIEAQAQGLEAATGQQPLTEDEMLAAQFHVEQRRQDGTPAGQRFAADFDAGRVSPREALEAFRLTQAPEFTLPQPGVDAAEIDPAAAGALVAPGALPQSELLPVGQATEVPVDVAEPAAPIEEPRAARTPGAEGQTIDPRSPNAVAQYVDRVRAINTPAARAFVQDFEAGRITPADVMQLVAPGQENADANLQTARRALGLKDVAGTQAPDGTRLLGPDGLPLPPAAAPRTLRDAQAKRAAEKAQQQEAASDQPAPVPAAEAPAAQQQPAPAAPAGAAPAATVAQPAQVAAEPASAPKAGEKWHYRSSEAGTPMREIPAERMQDAREVPDLVPGLRFLAHRDMGDGKTWSVTERNTGLTLTTGHTTADLADFAARQRVQQVGADKVQARVRETLQKSGLSEGEALGVTAEPRKGKVPGLDEVVAAYKRAAGGELDANMNATAVAFHRALADQNVKTIRDLAHPDNPKSRAVIEALSGKKLARGAMQSANIAEGWLRSLHPKPVTPQVPAPAPNAAAPVSTQAPAPAAGATVAAAPATPTDPVAKRRAVLQALRDCIAG